MIHSDAVVLWVIHQQPNTTEQQQTKYIYKHMGKESKIKLYAAVFLRTESDSYYQSGKSFALAHSPICCHPDPGK